MVNAKRTISELKELRELTADEHGAQRVAWTDTWLRAREWFTAKLAGLPDTAGGVFVSGGSAANLSALVAARAAHQKLHPRPARYAVAVTSEAHASIR